MFENLTNKLENIFKRLRGTVVLNEKNITEALRQVRIALLEADVNYKVVEQFIEKVKQQAIGQTVLSSLTPAQHVIKIVYDEIIQLLGGASSNISHEILNIIPDRLNKIVLLGLQGSGKTTTAVKLAFFYKKKGYSPYLVAADTYRPAAIKQLELLGSQINIPVFSINSSQSAIEVCKKALTFGLQHSYNLAIVDTAGRLHIDSQQVKELQEIKQILCPEEALLVCDAMTGQDAVNIADRFHKEIGITGIILTKLDGDSRGGAVLSIKAVTGQPIKFIGIGEKIDDFQQFYADRIASRILGMGDVLTLIEKAQENFELEKAQQLEEKLRKKQFTLEDYLTQIQQIRKMGSFDSLLSMLPGVSNKITSEFALQSEKQLKKIEAIINSMTPAERKNPEIINGRRRERIARGSGTTIQDVNRLLKQYELMKKMMKQMISKKNLRNFSFLEKMFKV